MKNQTITTAPVSPVLVNEKQETIRSVEQLTRDAFTIHEDGRVDIRDKNVSASEMALFIADRENTGARYKTQARWTFYAAGQLQNGTEVQAEIAKRLKEMLSSSAFAQLKSEALNLCPLAIANDIKAPLSILKDAVAELAINERTRKLSPLAQQSKAAKELIPLLKAGVVTQAKVREVRAKHSTQSANPTRPAPPVAKKDDSEAGAVLAHASAIGHLGMAKKYVEEVNPQGDDRQAFINILCEMGRLLGVQVIMPGKTPVLANIVAKVQAKQEETKK